MTNPHATTTKSPLINGNLRASNIYKTFSEKKKKEKKMPLTNLSLPLNGVDTHRHLVLLRSCHVLSFSHLPSPC